jgi:thymidylate synthase
MLTETTPAEVNKEEVQYLSLVSDIINNGEKRNDRTGTGTLSLFAPPQLRFSLEHNTLPLLTTKRVAVKSVFEELVWFINGHTDANILTKKNIRIWDGNASREYLDKVGLHHRKQGDLGPVYGFQWRHFGATYSDAYSDYSNQGVDQLLDVITKIKTNPTDRRIVMSAWNPAGTYTTNTNTLALKEMALPPCHMFCQFYVQLDSEHIPKLHCQLYQRSCDMGLGVPFNIASYSILTILIAYVCGINPGSFIHCLGDAHVYSDHIDPLKTQLQRTPLQFPKLYIRKAEYEPLDDEEARLERCNWTPEQAVKELEKFTYSRLDIQGYNPHAKIAMQMSA